MKTPEHLLVASYSVPNTLLTVGHVRFPPHTEQTHRQTNAFYKPSKVTLLSLLGIL